MYKRLAFLSLLLVLSLTGCRSSEMEKLNKEAYTFYTSKDFDKAVELYTKAIEKYPEYSDLYANRGIVYYELSEVDLAQADLDKAIELDEKNPEAYGNRGYVNVALGYNNAALEDLTKALELKDKFDTKEGLYTAYLNMGTVQNNLENKEDALSYYDEAIKLGTKDPGVYNARGMVLKDLERYDEAKEDFGRALSLDQNYANAYANRGSLFLIQKKYDLALADLNTALKVGGDAPQIYFLLGQTLSATGDSQGAITAFSTTLEKWPGYSDAYPSRAAEYAKVESYTDAIIDYKFAIDYGFTEAYKNLGYMFHKIGQNQDAIDSFNAYIVAVGDDLETYMQMGMIYQEMEDYLKSLQMFDMAIALSDNYPDPYILKGISCEYMGNDTLALELFNKALEIDPTNQTALDEVRFIQEK